MENNPLKDLIDVSMARLRELVDVNTIIGKAIPAGEETVIIPVSKVSFGFGSGGSELPNNPKSADLGKVLPFGGGGGGGVTISPVAFIVCKGDTVDLLELSGGSTQMEKFIGAVPETINKLTEIFSKNKTEIFSKNKSEKSDESSKEE